MAQDFALQFKRQYADSLDADYMKTTTERLAYVNSPNNRYEGMIVYDTTLKKHFYLSSDLTNWVEFSQSENYTKIKYDELLNKITKNELVSGSYYLITDYQTIHIIPNTNNAHLNVHGTVYTNKTQYVYDTNTNGVYTEGVEPLIVLAVTNNKISSQASSQLYPNDIISYDISSTLCEDGITRRKGLIAYRKDTIQNIECWYDWRNVLLIRYKIIPDAYSATTTYAKNAMVLYNNEVYVCCLANTLNVLPSNSTSNANWGLVYKVNNTVKQLRWYLATTTTNFRLVDTICPVDANDFVHISTFAIITNELTGQSIPYWDKNQVYNISIGRGDKGIIPNNVFIVDKDRAGVGFRDIDIAETSINNTFLREVNTFKSNVALRNNIFTSSTYAVTVGIWFANNLFGDSSGFPLEYLRAGDWCDKNICHGASNTYWRGKVAANIWKSTCRKSTYTYDCTGNVFHFVSSENTFNQRVVNCTFKGSVIEVTTNAVVHTCTFNNYLERMVFDVRVDALTVTANTNKLNVTLSYRSPSNKYFYTTIDDEGVITAIELI
jgi:hypothetical protein